MSYMVNIEPMGHSIECEGGENLLDLLIDAGVVLNTPCGGRGTCGKCLVKVQGSVELPSPDEAKFLTKDGERLACKVVVNGDLTVEVDHPLKFDKGLDIDKIPMGDYGVAVDIGTTSVHMSLVNIKSKKNYKLGSFLNPQRRFGHDVISRIAQSSDDENRQKMTDLIKQEIESILAEVQRLNSGIKLIEGVYASNTTMSYLISGFNPQSLGVYPYNTEHINFDKAIEIAKIPFVGLPSASAYLGGDIMGGLAIADSMGLDKNIFFIDLGTNGEMFVRNKDGEITATSCAMGPALEGMNISCGMTASSGAISHIEYDEDYEELSMNIIGDEKPIGLSGTAIIDLVAILIENEGVNSQGRLLKSGWYIDGLSIDESGVVAVAPSVFINQKDIREVQLAKGAVLAAAELLLQEANIDLSSIETVVIAGAFGENLDLGNFRTLKFIPKFINANYKFIGNSSLQAAEESIKDPNFMIKVNEIREKVKVIELSNHKDFNDRFLESVNF